MTTEALRRRGKVQRVVVTGGRDAVVTLDAADALRHVSPVLERMG
jgi:UPF0288 family protein (methanogenesis marker protein 3)